MDELTGSGIMEDGEAKVVYFNDQKALKNILRWCKKATVPQTTTMKRGHARASRKSWQPSEVIYVTDGRQQLHFQQLFALYTRWKPQHAMKLNHVWFGAILGEDGRPFKTRSGEIIRLSDLLNEAEQRAFDAVTEEPDLSEDDRREIARVVGIGAIKYADLSGNRERLRVWLGQHARVGWQHRAVSALRLHAHPQYLSQLRASRSSRRLAFRLAKRRSLWPSTCCSSAWCWNR